MMVWRADRPAFTWVVALLLVAVPRLLVAQDIICDPGDTEVRHVRFVGNSTFSGALLEERIVTTPSSALYRAIHILGARRCLDPSALGDDVRRLRIFYGQHGFRAATVSMDTVRVGESALDVTFRITEGAPTLVTSVTITGLDSVVDAARVRDAMTIRPGDRFDPTVVTLVHQRMVDVLRDVGYPRAYVALDYSTQDGTIAFTVLERALATIEHVQVTVDTSGGHRQQIDDDVIRRLLGFYAGERYSARLLVDAQYNLFLTDAFQPVLVQLAPEARQPANDSSVVIDVLLGERPMHHVTAGVGWGTLDCFRTSLTMINRNFFGSARRMEATARLSKIGVGYPLDFAKSLCYKTAREDIYSDTLNYRAEINLRQPGLFGLHPRDVPSFSIYTEKRSEYLAYLRTVTVGGITTFPLDIGNDRRLSLSYQLELGRTEAQPAIYCAVFNICSDEERARVGAQQRLAVLSASAIQDRSSADGFVTRLEVRHASTAVLSDPTLQFTTFSGDLRRQRHLSNGIAVAGRISGGVVLGNRLSLNEPDAATRSVSQYVPPQERMYLGGPNSMRGFGYNLQGPAVYIVDDIAVTPATGDTAYFRARDGVGPRRAVPTGGNSLVLANLEARVRSPFLGNVLEYALFVDAGQVWNRSAVGGASVEASFSGLQVTPGIGLRVYSGSVGPFRVDIGYNPYQRRSGVAYYEAAVQANGSAPLYCVSPGNTLKVVGSTNPPRPGDAIQIQGSGICGATFAPPHRSFLNRLTFNFAIGQPF